MNKKRMRTGHLLAMIFGHDLIGNRRTLGTYCWTQDPDQGPSGGSGPTEPSDPGDKANGGLSDPGNTEAPEPLSGTDTVQSGGGSDVLQADDLPKAPANPVTQEPGSGTTVEQPAGEVSVEGSSGPESPIGEETNPDDKPLPPAADSSDAT